MEHFRRGLVMPGPNAPTGSSPPMPGMSQTGAEPSAVPAEFSSDRLPGASDTARHSEVPMPAVRFNMPSQPVAAASFPDPGGIWECDLRLIGSITATGPNLLKGLSVDPSGLRLEASGAMGQIVDGLRVNGIRFAAGKNGPTALDTSGITFGATAGARWLTVETRFVPEATWIVRGYTKVDLLRDSGAYGKVAWSGQLGFELQLARHRAQWARAEESEESEDVTTGGGDDTTGWTLLGGLALGGILLIVAPEALPALAAL